MTTATSVQHDPMHELENVLHQLEDNNGNFVLDYSRLILLRRTMSASRS